MAHQADLHIEAAGEEREGEGSGGNNLEKREMRILQKMLRGHTSTP